MFYSKSISAQVNGIKSIEAGILFIYMTSTGIALLIIGFIACMVWYFSEPSADEGRLVWKNGPASSKAASYRGRDALWGDQAHAVVK